MRRAQGLLRAALPALGDASLSIDGQFGPSTLNAVQTFQQGAQLTVDGQVGPLTWQKLIDG